MTSPVSREALAWFVRLREDQATATEHADFARWLGSDPAHAEAFARAEAIWQGFSPVGEELGRIRSKTIGRRGFLAGSALLAAGWWSSRPGRFADEVTGTGQTRSLTLADGSVVELAPRTALSTDFRLVTLHRGEAHFTIARNAEPFAVRVGSGVVRTRESLFNITLGPEYGRLTVTGSSAELGLRTLRPVTISAGAEVTFTDDAIGTPSAANPARLAWRSGRLIFDAEPLAQVLDQIARYSGQRFVFLDGDARTIPVTSAFDIARIDGATRALAAALPVQFRDVAGFTLVS